MISSLLDDRKMVSLTDWAVTLVCDKNKGFPTFPTFHASLIFEGVKIPKLEETTLPDNTSVYFFRVAHLQGPSRSDPKGQGCFLGKDSIGVVALSNHKTRDSFQPRYSHKTKTWIRSCASIKTLIVEIKREKDREVPFNILGNKSIFSKAVEIFDIYDAVIADLKKQNPFLFLRLYDSAENGGEPTGMSREDFDLTIADLENFDKCWDYGSLIKLVKTATVKLEENQNNCFTWCRSKIFKIGIHLDDYQLEKLISVTTLYANCKINEQVDEDVEDLELEGALEADHMNVIPITARPLLERFVTYDVKRDKRTEEWKPIEQKASSNALYSVTTSLAIGVAGFAGFFGIIKALPTNMSGMATSLALTTLWSSLIAGKILTDKAKENHLEIVESSISNNSRLNQPGNARQLNNLLDPNYLN